MVRGISAYNSIKRPLAGKFNQPKKAVTNAAKETKNQLQQFMVLPGAVAGTYTIANLNQIKCGKGCTDFDCDWNVYTFG